MTVQATNEKRAPKGSRPKAKPKVSKPTCEGPHPEVPPRGHLRPAQHQPSPTIPTKAEPPQAAPVGISQAQAIQELARRAGNGNERCQAGLKQLLDQKPEVWQAVGNASALAERAWVDLLASGNRLAFESIPRKLTELKAQ
jgi:hypothetical protein